jgi:hypothetical protein
VLQLLLNGGVPKVSRRSTASVGTAASSLYRALALMLKVTLLHTHG